MPRVPLSLALPLGLCLILALSPGLGIRLLSSSGAADSTFAVLTQHNDNSRSGLDLNETVLTASNVQASQFGKLFARQVDGQLYAQPLYVPNLTLPGQGTHNVVIAATMHNTVYAFDADDPNASTPLWHVNLGPSIPVPDPCFGGGPGIYNDIKVEVGILSTPVIDLASSTIYVLAGTKDAPSGAGTCNPSAYVHRLHALDLTTGNEKFGGPAVIQASAAGTGPDSTGGTITFNNMQELQRSALLLANGVVYIAFASYGDTDPYHGWLLGYDAATLQQRYVFIAASHPTSTGGYEGGIWQSGQGPSTDAAGNIYINTGNGTWDADTGGDDYGNSVVKLSPSLLVLDWFTPYNQNVLNQLDLDLGSSGALLMPGGDRVLAGGKQGVLYLLDANNLGHYHAGADSQILQSFQVATGHVHGSPICWNGPSGELCYVWGEFDHLKAFAYANGQFNTTPVSQSAMAAPSGMPGGFLSLSANGNTPGSGIVWASLPLNGDANQQTVPGILRAFDASTLAELWDSEQNSGRDSVGDFAKFAPPTVANGKVYLGTFSGSLNVYGLLPPDSSSPTPTATNTPRVSTTPSATGTRTATGTPTGTPVASPLTYNNAGIVDDGVANRAGFDGAGNSYSTQALAAVGAHPGQPFTAAGITFQWPNAAGGTPDNVIAQGQTITLAAPAAGSSLAFLGAASSGPSSGSGTITYGDATTQTFTLSLSDWTLNGGTRQPGAGNSIALSTAHRNTQGGGSEQVATDVFVTQVGLQPGKSVVSVTLPSAPSSGQLHIFALTVTGSTSGPSPTGTATGTSSPTTTRTATPTTTATGTPSTTATLATTSTPTAGPSSTATATPFFTATITASATPAARSGFVLPFNNDGSSSDRAANQANFDGLGDSYSIQALAAAGLSAGQPVSVNGATFTWPAQAPGGADNLVAQGQTLSLTTPTGGVALAFLGASNGGSATGNGIITYSDGTTQRFTMALNDWLGSRMRRPIAGNVTVAVTSYQNTQSGARHPGQPRIFYTEVPVQAGKRLARVTLPMSATGGQLHIFAMALR